MSESTLVALASPTVIGMGQFRAAGGHRQCSRPTCSDPADVTLTYEYRQSQVWLDHLSADRDPNDYDLCGRHSAALTVPLGWNLTDRRQPSFRRDLLAG